MNLTPEVIAAHKELMTKPKKNGIEIPSLTECFEESEESTAKHILYDEYIGKINKPIPKVIFYIVMDDIYKSRIAKADDGNIGWKLKLRNY